MSVVGIALPTAVSRATAPVGRLVADTGAVVGASVGWVARCAGKVERILDQVIDTLDAAAPVVPALVEALEAGLLDEVRVAMLRLDEAVTTMGRVSDQMEQAMPLLDATGAGIGLVNTTIGTTIGSVQGLPGVGLVRRFSRPGAAGAPALVGADEG